MDSTVANFILPAIVLGLIPAWIAHARGLTSGPETTPRPMNFFGWWIFGALLFIVALPVAIVSKRKTVPVSVQEGSTTIACEACGGVVSTAAAACPHCGHPREVPPQFKRPSAAAPIVASILAIGAAAALYLSPPLAPLSGLPKCDSDYAKANVKKAMADAPFGKVLGLSIIEFRTIRTVSRSDAEVRCGATVSLDNASTRELSYSFETRGGQVFVKAQVSGF